jgi:hypothetical protein
MSNFPLNLGTLVVAVSVLFSAQSHAFASMHHETRRTKRVVSAKMRLENVHIEGESIHHLFSQFAFHYDIPVGLEIGLDGDVPRFYRIEFRKGTLSDLLTQFVAEHDEHTWKIEKGSISIFPKDIVILC